MVSTGTVQRQHLVQTLTFKRRLIGIFCVIFAAFVRIRLRRKNNGQKALFYMITTIFIACTAFLAVDVIAVQPIVSFGIAFASSALYTFIDLISQVILVNYLIYMIHSPPLVLMRVAFPFQ